MSSIERLPGADLGAVALWRLPSAATVDLQSRAVALSMLAPLPEDLEPGEPAVQALLAQLSPLPPGLLILSWADKPATQQALTFAAAEAARRLGGWSCACWESGAQLGWSATDAAGLPMWMLTQFGPLARAASARSILATAPAPSGKPLVSVIVRSIGRASLAQALDSVALQTYRPLEIVLVDAALSHDQPWPTSLADVSLRLPSTSGQKRGRADAANFGLNHAEGELALFLDDDDLLLPDHVFRLQAALAAHPDAPAAFSDTDFGYVDNGVWHSMHRFEASFDAVRLRFENFLPIHSVLFRHGARTPRVDPAFDLFEDWDFWLQMAQLGSFVHVEGVSARYVAGLGQRSGVFVDSLTTCQARQRLLSKWRLTSSAQAHADLVDRLQQLYREHAQAQALLAAANAGQNHLHQVISAREAELASAQKQLQSLRELVMARQTELEAFAHQAKDMQDLLLARETAAVDAAEYAKSLLRVLAARDTSLAEAARHAAGLTQLAAQRESDWAQAAAYADNLLQHLQALQTETTRAASAHARQQQQSGVLEQQSVAREQQLKSALEALQAELSEHLKQPPLRAGWNAFKRQRQWAK